MLSMVKSLSKFSLWLVALVLVSCDELPTIPGSGLVPGPAQVGRVHVEAPGVFVNNRLVAGTVLLFDNDDVRTNGTGWATISFNAGGTLRLEPNSDPLLRLVTEAGCLGAELVAYIRTGIFDFRDVVKVCFCDVENEVCGMSQSDFRVVIDNRGASITVSKGAVLVSTGYPRPREQFRVAQGQGITVRGGKTRGPQRVIQ